MSAPADALTLRPGRAGDAPHLAAFVAMADPEMAEFIGGLAAPQPAEQALAEFARAAEPTRFSHAHALVAEIEGEVAAAIVSFPADDQHRLDQPLLAWLAQRHVQLDRLVLEGIPGTWYLLAMGAYPRFRGHGLGLTLMKASMAEGARRGFARASLLVDSEKPKLHALYGELGFSGTDVVVVYRRRYYQMSAALHRPGNHSE